MSKKSKTALTAIAKVGEALPEIGKTVMKVTAWAVDTVKAHKQSGKKPTQAYTPPVGVIPQGQSTEMAMDFAGAMGATPVFNAIEYAQEYNISMGFPGYAVLAELAQVSEYRSPVETIAKEMTRKWGEIKSTGDEDRSDVIKQIVTEFKRLGVKEVCRQLIEHDGHYGRGQVYLDFGTTDDFDLPLTISNKTIEQGSLKKLKVIEPMWTAAQQYNADNPLNDNFYKPSKWFCFSQSIHDSRLITIVSRPVPDMLKPAYNFGGISLTQLLVPYVDNWLSARQTVNELLRKFSTSGFKTDMGTVISGGGAENLINRAEIFNAMRDNFGTLLIDKDKEEFFQFNVPLSGVDRLQSQAQEQMAAPTHIPLVKLFGITPSGLNATSEGEIQVWHEYLRAEQENILDKPVHKILQIVQLSLFGEIYDDIVFEWNPLAEMTEEQQANVNKTKADTGAVLVEAGIISQEEERTRIATDPMSGYNGLDVADVPEMPEGDFDDGEEVGEHADDPKLATDINPNHSDSNGQFVSGGGNGSSSEKEEPDDNPANHKGKATVEHLFEVASSRKGGNKSFAILGKVSTDYADKVKQAIGLDVSDFEHGIDESHLRHVLIRHTDETKEALQAQIPVTLDDIKNLPEILNNPDSVKDVGLSTDGNKSVEITKTIGNRVVCVQEVRTGRKKMNVTTMRIEKTHKKSV